MRNQSRARSTPGISGRLIAERQEIGRRKPILRVNYGFHSLRTYSRPGFLKASA